MALKMRYSIAVVLWLFLVLALSCDYFEEQPYEISLFDEGASTLLDNNYTALTQSLKLIVLERIDSTWTDDFVDSAIANSGERNRVLDTLRVREQRLVPSTTKIDVSMSGNYSSGYLLLDLREASSLDDYVFYFENHLIMSIWGLSGSRIELSNDAIPWGVVARSPKVKGRFSFTLENTEYIVRFTKSEGMIEEGESSFELVFLPEEYSVSSFMENICEILQNSKEDGIGIGLKTMGDIDSMWVNSDVSDIMGVDSTRSIMVDYLDSEQASLSSAHANQRIDVSKQLTVEEGYMSIDLSQSAANTEWQFYLTEYLDISIWSALDGVLVEDTESGVTFTETGACSNIRQKSVYTLDNQKYVIVFTAMDPVNEFSKFHLLFLSGE